jgi:hypothetical protein
VQPQPTSKNLKTILNIHRQHRDRKILEAFSSIDNESSGKKYITHTIHFTHALLLPEE